MTNTIRESCSSASQSVLERLAKLERRVEGGPDANALSMVVFSGELDKLLAAFVIATGAAASEMRVSMFFTFWGTAALKKDAAQSRGKSWVEWAFGWMLPRGAGRTALSQMDMCGLGRMLMQSEMKKKNIADLDQLIPTAAELGVKIRVCEMSMQLMGIRREELIDYPGLDYCGVATFADLTSKANTTLFI